MVSMPSLAFAGDTKFALALAVGLGLVVLARWASRARGSKRDTWVALRIGDVLFTEIIGAFLLGYGLGGVIAPPETAGPGGPPTRIGPAGRFGGLGASLPYTLAIVGAALAVLTRVDLSALVTRGAAPGRGLSTYVGWDGQVIAPIRAGGYGQITIRDAMGYPLSAGATADTDIAPGTPVRVIGTKGLELVVAPIPPANSTEPGKT
jgi:membrane protein implicated in regulation of membrane protease activity